MFIIHLKTLSPLLSRIIPTTTTNNAMPRISLVDKKCHICPDEGVQCHFDDMASAFNDLTHQVLTISLGFPIVGRGIHKAYLIATYC